MPRSLLVQFALLLSLLAAGSTLAQGQVLLEYYEHNHDLAERSAEPRLRVYASGRAELTQPYYKRDAGRYQLQLTSSELAQLQRRCDSQVLAAVDSVVLMENAFGGELAAKHASNSRSYTSDATVHELRIDPDGRNQILILDSLRRYPRRAGDSAALVEYRELIGVLQTLQRHSSAISVGAVAAQ